LSSAAAEGSPLERRVRHRSGRNRHSRGLSTDVRSSDQRFWPPYDYYDYGYCCDDQACYARIVVGAVDRKELPCEVMHGVEKRCDENAPTRLVVEPCDDDAGCHRAERPPSDKRSLTAAPTAAV
jgi:hypothetical protein